MGSRTVVGSCLDIGQISCKPDVLSIVQTPDLLACLFEELYCPFLIHKAGKFKFERYLAGFFVQPNQFVIIADRLDFLAGGHFQ